MPVPLVHKSDKNHVPVTSIIMRHNWNTVIFSLLLLAAETLNKVNYSFIYSRIDDLTLFQVCLIRNIPKLSQMRQSLYEFL